MRQGWIVLTAVFMFALSSLVHGQTVEKEAVRVPLENYLKAHATGNAAFARKAFHTEGMMIYIKDGKYTSETFDAFIKRAFTGKPAVDEEKRKDKRTIESIDISGNAANAKIVLDYPKVTFVDYMTLLRIDGEWKIVSKVFYAEPKAAADTKKQ
ncbi:MAG: nuclear transport factor 2 family protein [Pyrinomonadaceae bacterium]